MSEDVYLCDWCGEPIEDDDGRITVIEGEPRQDARILAQFHEGVCAREAHDYGWK